MHELWLLKLGGSIITHKEAADFAPRSAHIAAIAHHIADAARDPRKDFIIVHGGGSAAHTIAAQHNLRAGTRGDAAKVATAHAITTNLHRLQDAVVHALQRAGAAAVGVRSEHIFTTHAGALAHSDLPPLGALLRNRRIVVLSGAVVPDMRWGHAILSGDTIVAHIARHFDTHHIALASDTDGLFSADPHTTPDATHIDSITLRDALDARIATGAHTTDVTGGMAGKLQAFAPLLDLPHTPTITLFNGTISANFSRLFHAPDTLTCTRIVV